MKKYVWPFITLCCFSPAFADYNVMFGNKINSLTLYTAQSVGSGSLLHLIQPGLWDFMPQTLLIAQYSQPIKFFRLDSRLNLSAVQNIAYNSNQGLSFFGMGISIDTALLQYQGFYAGIGIGPYMRNNNDKWVSSKLVFGEKVFLGKNISDNWHLEFYTIHFSNGDFTPVNKGFNFFGFGAGYRF
ncbi:MAG: acyloxyacyl hydrolase [Alphaproteobacteria bacterium]|nr:acyloxyacyl hydrolase [Alphaproteobacteria bacterium]